MHSTRDPFGQETITVPLLSVDEILAALAPEPPPEAPIQHGSWLMNDEAAKVFAPETRDHCSYYKESVYAPCTHACSTTEPCWLLRGTQAIVDAS